MNNDRCSLLKCVTPNLATWVILVGRDSDLDARMVILENRLTRKKGFGSFIRLFLVRAFAAAPPNGRDQQ